MSEKNVILRFRYNRPPWTTGILIPASFLCGIIAAVFIARGGHKTKKTAEVEDRLRKALAQGRSSRAGDEPNGVYARRAGLVGIVPMHNDDDETNEDEGSRSHGNGTEAERSSAPNGQTTARSDHERIGSNGNMHM